MDLSSLYRTPGKTVVTAHRGFSGSYPENTLTAFRQAMALGVDIVEFDIRETADGELVIIHDATVDRTTEAQGAVRALRCDELRTLNATCWAGSHSAGHRLTKPAGNERIPLLTEALELMAGRVGMNLQVYTSTPEALERIVDLYHAYRLDRSAFLMLRSFDEAQTVRQLHPHIPICVGEERDHPERHAAFGVNFMQPRRHQLSDEFLARIRATNLPFNVFYANTEEEMRSLLAQGVPGILTDHPDRLMRLETLEQFK